METPVLYKKANSTRLLSTFKELRLYRDRSFILDTISKKILNKSVFITVLSSSRRDAIEFFSNATIGVTYLRGLFTEKLLKFKALNGLIYTQRQKLQSVYKEIKGHLPFLKYLYLNPSQYRNFNLIYDVSPLLTLFDQCKLNSRSMYINQCYVIMDKIVQDPRFLSYKKKYIVILLEDTPKIDATYYIKNQVFSINQAFFYRLFNDCSTMQPFLNTTIIITGKHKLFTYFTIKPEYILEGFPHKILLLRHMKAIWAYESRDVDAMLEAESLIEKDTDDGDIEKTDADSIISTIAKNLISNSSLSTTSLKSSLISLGDNDNSEEIHAMTTHNSKRDTEKLTDAIDTLDSIIDTDEKKNEIDDMNTDPTDLDTALSLNTILGNKELSDDDKEMDDLYKKAITVAIKHKTSSETDVAIKRIKLANSNFEKLSFDSGKNQKKFKEILDDFEKTNIESIEFPVNTPNTSIKRSTAQDMTRTYYAKQLDADIVQILKMFTEAPDIQFAVTNVQKEDVSDTLNAVMKYTFTLKDEFGKSHTITYDIPKLIDNKFFLLGGNKKILDYQITAIPVIKIDPNLVHISTAHNQMELRRFGKSFDPKIEIFKKFLSKIPVDGTHGITYKIGDSSGINAQYMTTLEYNSLSESIYTISIISKDKKHSVSFVFNQRDIRDMMENLDIPYTEKPGLMPVAITESKSIVHININSGKDAKLEKYTIVDLMFEAIRKYADIDDIDSIIHKLTVSKKYMYTRMYYISRMLSIGLFLGYLYGLTTLLKTMGVSYTIVGQDEKITKESLLTKNRIIFKNASLLYDIYPLRHSLILNGIACEMDCESYTIEELDTELPYVKTFDAIFHTVHMAKGFNECKIWMIDPISAKVLKRLNLPYEFLDVMLYANSLLEDDSFVDPKNTSVNRLRKLELIPVYMYKSMVRSYQQYKYRYGKRGNMIVKRNDILKMLSESRLCNDYDTLNPIREIESESAITYKGPGGCNINDAYTLSRRAYDKSMVGVYGLGTPDGPAVGITKHLSLNPRITDTMGFMKSGASDDIQDISFGNMGSVGELLVPGSIDHDDAKRIGLVGKESKHIMAADDTDPLLIGNGVEKVVPYMTSSDFITIAKDDGKVLSVDKDIGIAIVKYKNGSVESIDIVDREHKDGGMGFWIISRKAFAYKEGDLFKKNDTLVYNPSYFSTERSVNAPEFNAGVLSNVAIVMSHTTFEDSSIITERIAKKLSTEVAFCKHVVIGAKANIQRVAHIGEEIAAGDALMVFEDEVDDPEIAEAISNSDMSDMKHLEEIVRHLPKSKVSGIIHNIKIYYTVPLTEMSETVRSLVNSYNKRIAARKKRIESYGATMPSDIIIDYVGITQPVNDKINGSYCPIGKVLIEFYTKYRDYPGSGDKIVFYAAMKSVIHRQLPIELAPYPVGRKDDPIDALLSPISVEARMVTCIVHALYGNKCVWALKERIRDLYQKYQNNELITEGELIGLTGDAITVALEEAAKLDIEPAQKTTKKSKNLYICLYRPKHSGNIALFTATIQKLTNSDVSHASIATLSDGIFYSLGVSDINQLIQKNGVLLKENLVKKINVPLDPNYRYTIYKLPVTEIDYQRACSIIKEQFEGHYKYSFLDIIKIGIKLIFRGTNEDLIRNFNMNSLYSTNLVCSTYVITTICLSIPSLLKEFMDNNIDIKYISPINIERVPGVVKLFDGNASIPYTFWKGLYEKEHGKLPN